MPNNKEVTEIIGHIRNAGFRVAKSGNQKHWKVMNKNGSAVIDANGPLIISSSPSEHRFREMTIQRLMAAGVLKADPYKKTKTGPADTNGSGQKRGNASHLARPEIQAAKIAAVKARSRAFHEKTVQLRGRVEPIIAKLGGWSLRTGPLGQSSGMSSTDFGRTAMHWGKTRGVTGTPEAGDNAVGAATRNLAKKDGTLGALWLPFFESFVNDLEEHAGKPPRPEKAAERYMQLYREMKGVPGDPPPRPIDGPVIRRQQEPQRPPDLDAAAEFLREQVHAKVGPSHAAKVPSLAIEAVALMAKGSPDDINKVIALGEKIAALEMGEA